MQFASQTEGKNNKYVLFPFFKDDLVSAVLVCKINEDRTFATFNIFTGKSFGSAEDIIAEFQAAYLNNQHTSTYSRAQEIEEVIITKYPVISSEGGMEIDWDLILNSAGGGDGGMNGGAPTFVPPPPQNDTLDPCAKAQELAQKMAKILNSTDIKSALAAINTLIQQQIANGQIKENAFAIGIDANGKYHVTPIATASDANPHSVNYQHFSSASGITQIGLFHNHTSDNSNSPGDLYELISSNMNNANYITNFAQNSLGEIFALNIYDRQKAMAFLQKYSKNQSIDGPNFKGDLLFEYEKFRSTADWTINNNTNGGQVALIAFLEKFDTGVSLSKKSNTSNFVTFKSSNNNQDIYGGQQQLTYTSTDCN